MPRMAGVFSRPAMKPVAVEEGDGSGGQSAGVAMADAHGLIGEKTAAFVAEHAAQLDAMVDREADRRFEYFGLRTVADRYLLRHPHTRLVLETPQHWLLRVACGLAHDVAAEGRRLGGALHLDVASVVGAHDVHVHVGGRVLRVVQVERGLALDDARLSQRRGALSQMLRRRLVSDGRSRDAG